MGSVAEDARAARVLAEGGNSKGFARSALARSARTLVSALADHRDVTAAASAVRPTPRSEVSA